MPTDIKHRYTGEIIRTVDADTLTGAYLRRADLRDAYLRGADLRRANLRYADLRGADLSRADLSYADLRGADLSRANLSYANLRDSDLSYANLSGADLRDADLRRADLSDANLRGAYLRDAYLRGAYLPPIPIVEQLDSQILAAIENGGGLEMETWHTCQTKHCRYGWAITLAGEAGKVLEGQVGSITAGALIYWKSAGYIPACDGENDAVLEDIRAHAEKEESNVND